MKDITIAKYRRREQWGETPTMEGLARELGSHAKTRAGIRRAVLRYIAEMPSRFETASRPRLLGYRPYSTSRENYRALSTLRRLTQQIYDLRMSEPGDALERLQAIHPYHRAALSRAASTLTNRPVDIEKYLTDNWLGIANRKYTPYLQERGTYTKVGRYVVYNDTSIVTDWNRYSKSWHARYGPVRTVAHNDIVIRWFIGNELHERRISIKGKSTTDPLAYAFLEAGLARPSQKDIKIKRHKAYRLEAVGECKYARYLGDTFFDYIICDEWVWVCGRTLDAAEEAYVSKIAEAMR